MPHPLMPFSLFLIQMVRRTAEGFEITTRMLGLVVGLITVSSVLLSIGASYAGTRFAIDSKVNKDSFQAHVSLGEQRWQQLQATIADVQRDNHRQDTVIATIGARLLGLNCYQAKYPLGLCDDVRRR